LTDSGVTLEANMVEAASVVAAVAAVGALYFAWRTVLEGRTARRGDERDRHLARLERLGLALTDLAAQIRSGARAQARITQALGYILWVSTGMQLSEDVRVALVTPIAAANENEIADRGRSRGRDHAHGP
jgi:hypothetical protein